MNATRLPIPRSCHIESCEVPPFSIWYVGSLMSLDVRKYMAEMRWYNTHVARSMMQSSRHTLILIRVKLSWYIVFYTWIQKLYCSYCLRNDLNLRFKNILALIWAISITVLFIFVKALIKVVFFMSQLLVVNRQYSL